MWVDLSLKGGGKKMYDAIKKHINSVDILINNAIINKGSRFLISKHHDDWEQEVSVNINGNIVLTQNIVNLMKIRKIKGRIINITSNSSKAFSTNLNSGSEILTQSMIEKYGKLLADELYSYKIAVTTVRINDNISRNKKGYFNFKSDDSFLKKHFGSTFSDNLDKFMPLFMYSIKAPYKEISGKIISSDSFNKNLKLSKVISPHQINLNSVYKNFEFNKFTRDKNKIYLVKQNPYDMSPNITKLLKKENLNTNNNESKFIPILDSVIARNLKIKKTNIVFFKTEYDCIKKIIEIFVPKYQSIIIINPIWNLLKLVSLENKINIEYSTHTEFKTKLTPNYSRIISLIDTKTKMIYLSSPNIISGQSIDINDFRDFLEKVPENIIVLLDQRFIEFSMKKDILKGEKFINKYKNLIVLRSFNNFYSIENLELCYLLTNKTLALFIKENTIINQIDFFNEKIALEVYKDTYYDKIKTKINNESKRVFSILKENNINYFPSETNFLLVKLVKNKEIIEKELERRNIILYKSNDYYNSFWTLPLSTKKNNESIIDVLIYSNL